ncbi:MAG TPA: PfkB family carbohydrate kinase [Armatimonadota bacterium]|jgi:sugar/nucleoside kinase (ribokinase family)
MSVSDRRPRVLVVGSVAFDNVKTPLGEVNDVLGGAAVYGSVSASFFAPVQLVGVVGEDFPQEHVDMLAARGIDLQGLQRVAGPTFRWKGFYDYDLNQAHSLDTQLGVFESFRPTIPDAYRDAEYVFLANIDPTLQLEVLDQVKSPTLTFCDTMNFWISGKKQELLKVLERVDVAFLNDAEARQLCDTFSLVKAAKELHRIGPSVVVIKKGEHGAVLFTKGDHFSAPSYPLEEVKDPTGAGDTFEGGFVGYLARTDDTSEANLRKAVVYGSVMASFNVEDFSLERMKRLTRPEIAARYREFKQMAYFEALEELALMESAED